MLRYFDANYLGPGFELFGPAHLGMVLFAIAIGAFLIRLGRQGPAERTRKIRIGIGAFLLLNETGTHIFKLANEMWTVTTDLPLQLCGAMAWISGFALVFGVRRLYPMLYFFGVAGAIQGVLTPDTTLYGFPHYLMVETIVAHSTLVIAGLWVVLVERYRPTALSFVWIILGLNAAALVMYFVNVGLGSNYLFVNAKPPNASIVDLLPPWPWYIAWLELIALLLFGALNLPFARFWKWRPKAAA